MNYSFFLVMLLLISIPQVHAVCPVCTVTVGAGIGLSRWLGIDDTITGLWVGGLVVSMTMWTISWLDKKNVHFKGRILITTVLYYGLVVVPLYFTGVMGHALHTLWGMDKLGVGIVLGSIGFLGAAQWYEIIKKKNHGHAYFPFQKVVMPISPLIILSILFYFLTK